MAMLTPGKIKGYQFQPAGRGTYKAEEVDDFLAQVVESYEQVFRENGELVQKLRLLVKKLNDLKKEESNISKVLVNAQTFIDKMIDEAKKEAKTIVSDAEERAKNVDSITNAKIKVMVDEVEGKMRLAYEKAMAQAKSTKDSAYKEAEILILEAREKAEKIISDAEATAAALISDATKDAEKEAAALKEEIEKEKELLDSLKETSNQFKTELVVLYERQLKSVEQMPDYVLDKELEEKVKKIVEEKNSEEEATEEPETDESAVEKIVDTFVASEDDFFDADDLIREYAGTSDDDDEGFSFDFDDAPQGGKTPSVDDFFSFEDIEAKAEEAVSEEVYEEADDESQPEENAEDTFSFELSDEEIEKIETEAEEAVESEISEEIKAKEAEIQEAIEKEMAEAGFSFDFDESESDEEISEEADEYEDIFSDSGEGEGFRFTAEDFEEIKSGEKEKEAAFDFRTEDVDLFSEEAAKNDIPVSRPERRRQVDISISENTAAEVDKDESLFLARDEKVEKEDTGFKFFDDIDASDEDEGVDADDIFGKKDDDDDGDGFSFLKNIFGKNNN